MKTLKELPRGDIWQRYVKVRVRIKTWTIVEDIIVFDTFTNQFVIPSGYQVDAKVIEWDYYKEYECTGK